MRLERRHVGWLVIVGGLFAGALAVAGWRWAARRRARSLRDIESLRWAL